MHTLGTVQAQWRYPVKSLRGQSLARLRWDARGAAGDRLYALQTADGGFGSGKATHRFRGVDGLLEFSAESVDDEPPLVRLPDGRAMVAGDPVLDDALSRALGQPLRVVREAAVPHFDAAAVHLVTTASMAWLREQLPGATIDARRFRPNLVVATHAPAFAEHAWIGGTLAIGDTVRLEVIDRCERCVMVTLPQDDLPREPRLLRALAQDRDVQFGVYARVLTPGVTVVGDRVGLLPR